MGLRMRAALHASLVLLTAAGLSGCSVKRFMVNRAGDALTSGPSAYEADDDPQLVAEALPFSLKLVESLLAASPKHRGLLLSACKGYTLYAYAFVAQRAEMSGDEDVAKQREATARARNLFLRAHGFGVRGLEACRPGLRKAIEQDPAAALAKLTKRDVPLLYWSAASLALAISSAKGDAEMLARLPEVEAMLDRALALDEDWDGGQLHEFALNVAAAKPAGKPDPALLKKRYDRALELSRGHRASLFVAWAESVAVPRQDQPDFTAMLDKALAVDRGARPDLTLANTLSQRRATWLKAHADRFFLTDDTTTEETP